MRTPHPASSARLVTISIVFLAMLIVPGAHAVTFTAYALLDNPDHGHEFHTGGILQTATITGLSDDLRIEISGAAASAQHNLQWSLQMECDGDIDTSTDDLESNYIATCNMAGWWEHKAGGTGRIAGTWNNKAVGAHTVASYADFVDNNNSANRDMEEHLHDVSVVNP